MNIAALIVGLCAGILIGAVLLARHISKRTGQTMMQVLRGGGNGEERSQVQRGGGNGEER